METVVIANKTYVKAAHLAKQFRYTTDYIGQLCRADKVDCQLVGRSWFVTEASLLAHKDARYKENRSTEITNKVIVTMADEPEKVYPRLQKKTARNLTAVHRFSDGARLESKYFADEEPLVPVVRRRITPVIPALSQEKHVVSPEKPSKVKVFIAEKPKQKLNFTDIPAVSLHGELSVKSADIEPLVAEVSFLPSEDTVSVAKKQHGQPAAVANHKDLTVQAVTAKSSLYHVSVAQPTASVRYFSIVFFSAFISALALVSFFIIASSLLVFESGLLVQSSVTIDLLQLVKIWSQL
jgi:hypothetical protein